MDEPRERERPVADQSPPPGTVEARERLGRQVGLLWIGAFVLTGIVIGLVAWALW